MQIEKTLKGAAATTAFGHLLAQILTGGDVLALNGELGSGKSTLARGVIGRCLADIGHPLTDIPSPSFTLVQPYPWPSKADHEREIWHIDLWRIDDAAELVELGFDEALGRHAMIIEWPDRMGDDLPDAALQLTINSLDNGAARNLVIAGRSDVWGGRLDALMDD